MRRLALLAIVVVVVLLVLLGVAQLVLPSVAAQRLRDRLGRSGKVLDVEVHAFPAIKLLWHRADRVTIRLASYRSAPGHLSSLLDQAGEVGALDASARTFNTGLLIVRDATLRKRGNQLTASAFVDESDLRVAVPFLDNVQPVATGNGQLTLRGTATLLGLSATVDATVAAQNGQLVIQPDVPFGGLATVRLFDDPHVRIESVSASAAAGGFNVSARAVLG